MRPLIYGSVRYIINLFCKNELNIATPHPLLRIHKFLYYYLYIVTVRDTVEKTRGKLYTYCNMYLFILQSVH